MRFEYFQKDPAKYLEKMKGNIAEEERVFESSSQKLFEAISISPELFERSQQEMMMDPMVSMEMFQMGINMEKPTSEAPEELTKAKTVEIVKASNDFAFDYFKKEYLNQMSQDPLLMPVVISALGHDWVKHTHNYSEDQFKSALYKHKIFEDDEVAMHMQQKQMELLSLSGGFNPMMMGGMPPGMGGPGGMDPMAGMGGMDPMGGGMGGMPPGGMGGMFGPGGL